MMADNSHPVDDALRRVAADLEPTEPNRQLAEAQLQALISAESERQGRRIKLATLGWAVAALLGAVGAILLLQVIRPTPTHAAMEEIAVVVEASDPLTIPPQQYAYTSSQTTTLRIVPKEGLGDVEYDRDLLVYLLPAQRETWVGSDAVVQIRTTAGPPIFFHTEDETAYYAAGLDATDVLGETVTETMLLEPDPEAWPEDKAELGRAIRAMVNGQERPEPVEYVDIALDVIRESLISPQTRANALRLIGEQPGLRVEPVTDEGSSRFVLDYTDAGVATRLSFTISSEGHLLEEAETLLEPHPLLNVPAGVTVAHNVYGKTVIVGTLDSP